ncbi:MAG: alpha/beta hydrolase [Acidobacteriaceae bacterium]|nr:alpha/beta hydrolase [Acidobacteriaceae bacterium]
MALHPFESTVIGHILRSYARHVTATFVAFGAVLISANAPAHAPAKTPSVAVAASPASTTIRYRTLRVDGIDLFYREAGPSNAPVVLLLHGFPASSFMYRDLIPQLAARYRVVAPDYPGFGYSSAPSVKEFNYSFDHLADVIEKFTVELGLEKYSIYMQDFGGPVGFRLATRNPAKVASLIVQNANAYEDGLPDSFWKPARELWRNPSKANFAGIREAAMSKEALEWNYTHGVKDTTRISPDSWVLQGALLDRPGNKDIMLALLYDYRMNLKLYAKWHDYFRTYQPPMLIVWGEHDAIFPASGARAYLRDLPKAELHLLDTGHFALEEKSEEIGQFMTDFLHRHAK